ncbi:hypothetical protein [Pararhizobium qamdonense]|uniref:hypothetical protein n=1 Tax=Pararhizobium qamdonense TaxID=3031126 RepID=UPI0023E0B83A|nr:hypothetical protein [Pararhizobium qamdonense]
MPKFKITRRRMVTQSVTFEITVKEGVSPMEAGEAKAIKESTWSNDAVSPLSTDVAPVAEPEPEAEAIDG